MPESLRPREQFGALLIGTARRWRAAVDTHLASQGLTDATWAPLIHVGRVQGGISQKTLAIRIGIDGSSLVRLIDILAEKNLIERRQDQEDRRSNLLFLTAAGHQTVSRIQESLTQVESALLADIKDDKMALLVSALEQIDRRIAQCRDEEKEESV